MDEYYQINIDKTVKLEHSNVKSFVDFQQKLYSLRLMANSKNYWHQFTLLNAANLDKDLVLKGVLELVQPLELIPCQIQKIKNDLTFVAKLCGPAVEKLARKDLQLILPGKDPIFLHITLNYATFKEIHYNVFRQLEASFTKRYVDNCLDLSDYHNDPEIAKCMYIPLCFPRNLNFLLSACKKSFTSTLHEISLANNELVSLKPLELLVTCPNLTSLDLSHNKIDKIEELKILQQLKITNLILDSNPICQNWTGVMDYIKDIQKLCPGLIFLDGHKISVSMPPIKSTFLICPQAESFVDHFLTHYFSRYDCEDRAELAGIYHPQAQFSVTCTHVPGQETSENSRLQDYIQINRNMIKTSDYSKYVNLLHQGSNNILELLRKLPKTQHDPYSIAVDLIGYTKSLITISVTGVFREPTEFQEPPVRMFQRIFLITYTGGNQGDEFRIINDMFHLSNASTELYKNSFKKPLPPLYNPKVFNPWPPENNLPKILNSKEKFQMTKVLCQITTMNNEWSQKCLEEMKWEFQEALATFTKHFKSGSIPKEAFQK